MAIEDMPNRKNVKWGEMKAGESHLSEEWHDMEPSNGHMSDKWIEQHPSKGHMSDKWDNFENPSDDGKWHVMKQEKRDDPYAMEPSEGNRTQPFKPMAKVKPDNKVGRSTQHNEFGSTREI